METKTIYVPTVNKALNSRLTIYDKKDLSWYNDVYLEKQEGMIVMTKAEFEVMVKRFYIVGKEHEITKFDKEPTPNFDEYYKSILK